MVRSARKPPVSVSSGRVDRPAHRHVALVHRHLLDVVHRAGPGDVEDGEGGEVHHAHVLTHGEVLGVDDGRPPTGVPFVVAPGDPVLLHQRGVRPVPLGPLPSAHLEELRPQLHLAGVGGHGAHPAVGFPLLAGMDDAVGLVEVLGAAGQDVVLGAGVTVEPGDVGGMGIDLGITLGHPLGDHLADRRTLLDPHRRHRPQVFDLNRLTQQRHGVGGEGEEAVDGVADLGLRKDVGHQLEGLLHLLVEVLVREGHLGGGEERLAERGDFVGMVEDGPVGVGPHLHGAGCLAFVHVGVHVPHDREADLRPGLLEDRDGPHVDHLVDGRGERDRGPRHPGDPGAPHPAGHQHVVRLDPALVGHHRPDRPAFRLKIEHAGVGEHLEGIQALGPLSHDGPGP